MDVEIVPSEIADVMREPFKDTPERCRLINDSIGFESLYDAIFNSEHVGSRILRDVEPEDLFFILGQTLESLCYAPIVCPSPPPLFDEAKQVTGHGDDKKRNSDNKSKPKHRAVFLCKLRHPNLLKELTIWKKEDGRHYAKRYEITWSELQELKKCLGDFSGDHFNLPNDLAQPPL